jgi:hypothetical protein
MNLHRIARELAAKLPTSITDSCILEILDETFHDGNPISIVDRNQLFELIADAWHARWQEEVKTYPERPMSEIAKAAFDNCMLSVLEGDDVSIQVLSSLILSASRPAKTRSTDQLYVEVPAAAMEQLQGILYFLKGNREESTMMSHALDRDFTK